MATDKLILVIIDALRSDYISKNDSPFLHNFAENNRHYKYVKQSRSFCERSEIFTGLSPRESGYFAAIGFDPKDSPYKDLGWLVFFTYLDIFFSGNKLYENFKRRLLKFSLKKKGRVMSNYSIPSSILKFFSLTEDKHDFRLKEGFDGKDNIFRDCDKAGLKIYYDSFTALNIDKPSSDESRLKLVEDNIAKDYNLYLLYIGIMDTSGHQYGPQAKERIDNLRKIDQRLSKFYHNIKSISENTKFIFLGDHGMSEVVSCVDLNTEVKRIAATQKLKLGEDYVYFLDSTMFRIWYLNQHSREHFDKCLKKNDVLLKNGIFVDQTIAKSEGIPYPDRRYGDLLWMANLGVLVFPDFFHKDKPYKGMHGYDTRDLSSKGVCLVSAKESDHVEEINLTDLYEIIKTELGLN